MNFLSFDARKTHISDVMPGALCLLYDPFCKITNRIFFKLNLLKYLYGDQEHSYILQALNSWRNDGPSSQTKY